VRQSALSGAGVLSSSVEPDRGKDIIHRGVPLSSNHGCCNQAFDLWRLQVTVRSPWLHFWCDRNALHQAKREDDPWDFLLTASGTTNGTTQRQAAGVSCARSRNGATGSRRMASRSEDANGASRLNQVVTIFTFRWPAHGLIAR